MGIFSKPFAKPFATVSTAQVRAMLDDGAILVDVRTSQEWNAGHAPAARHMPLAAQGLTAAIVAGGTVAWQRSGGRVVAKSRREGTVA